MSIISWERRPDGNINVWNSPVRWHGRKRVIKEPDAFFESVKQISPFATYGLIDGNCGFCADPGIFTQTSSFIDRCMRDLEKNIVAMIADWRPVHINAANDAMKDIAPDYFEHNQNLSTWIMKYLRSVYELDCESPISAYETINDPETGYQTITRKHHAATLRNLLEYGMSHVLRTCDFYRVVQALHTGCSFKVELETMAESVQSYLTLRLSVDDYIHAHAADARHIKDELKRLKVAETALCSTRVFKLVNGRHPRLGRFGTAYAKSARGLRKEAERIMTLIGITRERFADVIEILGVEQVLNEAAMD